MAHTFYYAIALKPTPVDEPLSTHLQYCETIKSTSLSVGCLTKNETLSSASASECGHKRRRSGARIPVVTIMGWVTTAAAKATVVGPRAPVSSVDTGALKVWGPTDWEAEEAPTMAMLTTEASRQTKVPERKEGERPGPMWRTIFGGASPCVSSALRCGMYVVGVMPRTLLYMLTRSIQRQQSWRE